jgi:hypothetical protein
VDTNVSEENAVSVFRVEVGKMRMNSGFISIFEGT